LKSLLLNQAFYPDVVSTAQHAGDLCVRLAQSGHEVTVIASSRAYDDPRRVFVRAENWKGIAIQRIPSLGLGKRSQWRRALDFASFLFCCALKLVRTPKADVVIAMTSPPLVAFMASLFVRWKGGRLVYWVMDLNPDEAIAAGWLAEHSAVARILNWMLVSTLRQSAKIIVLDRFMHSRLVEKGIDPAVIETIAPWSHDHALHYDLQGRNAFRREHGLEGKFVVMYSGNHSPCHPLDSLLQAALRLADRSEIAFCFVGGGSEHAKVRVFAAAHGLKNILCLPYQPMDRLSASLSAADLHAVVMGDAFAGIVHPCKIYNVLCLGIPVLYVGPPEGHIPDLAPSRAQGVWFYSAAHGQVEAIIRHILSVASMRSYDNQEQRRIAIRYSADVLLDKMAALITDLDQEHSPVACATTAKSCAPSCAPLQPLPDGRGSDTSRARKHAASAH
jgi:glycosyltransferase involved in cell wall biosynthesis